MLGESFVNRAGFKAANFVRKNFSSRNIRFLLVLYIIGRIPFLRDYLCCYVKTISAEKICRGDPVRVESNDVLPLTDGEFSYLRSYGGYLDDGGQGKQLALQREFTSYAVPQCLILPRAFVPVHIPTKRLITSASATLSRNMVSFGRYPRRRSLAGAAYSMLSTPRGAGHYFHFFFDELIALLANYKAWKMDKPLNVLVRENVPTFQMPGLDYIAANLEHVRLERVAADEAIECEELIITYGRVNRPIDFFAFGESLESMRKIYYRHYEIDQKKPSRRIYVSRGKQKIRRITNESDVVSVLESHGFETIYPEELPHRDQVAIFSKASAVIGVTGAALTNLLFCSPGCRVVEIRPATLRYPLYIGLCKQMGLRHHFFEGSALSMDREIRIDTTALDRLLSGVLEGADG